jgi:meso-butanediol dehydrogenase/(S,S)-butanediol dehydrogenase/diacetyl reductase
VGRGTPNENGRADVERRFEGKVAIITGGASGIGAATARRFAHEGARVVVADINEGGARAVADEIGQAGGAAMAVGADVAEATAVEMMIARALESWGRLDVLHNNATMVESGTIERLTLAGWNRTLAVNLTATFLGIKHAAPVMRSGGGGAIVNTASISGLAGDFGLAAYNAAKAGVVNLTRTAALELARDRIRVNCICPGGIATPLLGSLLGDNAPVPHWQTARPAAERSRPTPEQQRRFRERLEHAHPLGRLGTPEEIAAVACFLASEDASFITGAAIVADGGVMAYTSIPSPRE